MSFNGLETFLRSLNTHNAAKLGASLVAAGTAIQSPPLQSGLDLIHDGGHAKTTVDAGGVAMIALGTFLLYLSRPFTVPSDLPGNHAP